MLDLEMAASLMYSSVLELSESEDDLKYTYHGNSEEDETFLRLIGVHLGRVD